MAAAYVAATGVAILSTYSYNYFQKMDHDLTPQISQQKFGPKLPTGQQAYQFTLKNEKSNLKVKILNYGATISAIEMPDKNNIVEDIVLGFSHIQQYIDSKSNFGNIVGRYGGRIGNQGTFELEGEKYKLECNNAPGNIPCHLHGGSYHFGKRFFEHEIVQSKNNEPGLKLKYISADGEAGYPGELELNVTYWLLNNNSLKVDYEAKVQGKSTVLNPTNHTYFNLMGGGKRPIVDHILQINSEKIVELNKGNTPTGNFYNVRNTPLDFTQFKTIGQDIKKIQSDEQLKFGNGYDHCYVIDQLKKLEGNSTGLKDIEMFKAAEVRDISSGRKMEVYTSEPGVQFYTGNHLGNSEDGLSKNGTTIYPQRAGFCLETQHYPDSPNQPNFPSTVLKPGQQFQSSTLFKFGIL